MMHNILSLIFRSDLVLFPFVSLRNTPMSNISSVYEFQLDPL